MGKLIRPLTAVFMAVMYRFTWVYYGPVCSLIPLQFYSNEELSCNLQIQTSTVVHTDQQMKFYIELILLNTAKHDTEIETNSDHINPCIFSKCNVFLRNFNH